MDEKKALYIETKIKKMQKTIDGLDRLILNSNSISPQEKKNLENMKETTKKAITESRKQLNFIQSNEN
jgi:hypothetical protein